MSIAKFVRKKRREQGISQKQLAEYADVSLTFVNRIENGDSKIQLTPLNKVLNVLGYEAGAVLQDRSRHLIEEDDE